MVELTQVLVGAFAAGVFAFLLILVIWRRLCFKKREGLVQTVTAKAPSFRAIHGFSRVHQAASVHHQPSDVKRRGNQHVFPRGVSGKPLFSWADHPSLINDAVENGWSQFAFSGNTSAPERSTVLGLSCAVGDHGKEAEAEIIWEVFQGSVEFMQKIRFNSGLQRVSTSQPSTYAASVIRTSLPLPGPYLGNNSAFPQEAYFEITILNSHSDDDDGSVGKNRKGEKTKLIQDNSYAKINKVEELKMEGEESSKRDEAVKLSLGLTTGGSVPSKLPGTYPGSIGFNSNGSVLLDGIKLVFESEEEEAEWGRTEKVIGCGFDPRQKKVFFTLDSQLLHVVYCKSEEFGTPLYPILAANTEILVVVNMGQSPFKYGPANAQRTPNPCFIRPPLNSPSAAMDYEDSSDLFSMTFDSQILHASAIKGTQSGNNRQAKAADHDPEVELFEIVLEDGRRS